MNRPISWRTSLYLVVAFICSFTHAFGQSEELAVPEDSKSFLELLQDAFTGGRAHMNVRFRAEIVEQEIKATTRENITWW